MKTTSDDSQFGQTRVDVPGETLLVRQDMVKSGDVLLTFGGGAVSAAIAQLSGGPFSHAAVFVSPLDLLESYDMIAHASLEPVGQGNVDGKNVHLSKLPHNPPLAELWRHPQPVEFDSEIFQDAYAAILKEQWGYDYPPYARLIPLAQLPDILKGLGKEVFKNYPRADFPGDFCSQLVARFYRHLKQPLFDDGRTPEKISPNDLPHSKLVQVKRAIVRRDEIKDFTPELGVLQNHQPLYTGGDVGATMMRKNLALSKQLDEIAELSRKRLVQNAETTRDVLKEQAKQLHEMLITAEDLSMTNMQVHVLKLWARFIKVVPNLFPNAESPQPQDLVAISEWSAIGRSLLRCKTILGGQLIRRKILAEKNPHELEKLKNGRQEILRGNRKLLGQLLLLSNLK